jgi:muconolactone delta-isomerase
MRFLATSTSKHLTPPEMVVGLIEAMQGWVQHWTEAGKFEYSWSSAGINAGGAIINVDSLEELDEILAGFPFGPFSEIQVTPIVDLIPSLERSKAVVLQAMEQMG